MTRNILFVEDDIVLLGILERFLREAGFDVTIAKDGEAALQLLEKTVFDVVLLDILLPTIDGFEVLKRIKADPKAAATNVIILSNLASPEDFKRGKELGAVDYLVKAATTPEEILAKIKQFFKEPDIVAEHQRR